MHNLNSGKKVRKYFVNIKDVLTTIEVCKSYVMFDICISNQYKFWHKKTRLHITYNTNIDR